MSPDEIRAFNDKWGFSVSSEQAEEALQAAMRAIDEAPLWHTATVVSALAPVVCPYCQGWWTEPCALHRDHRDAFDGETFGVIR